jgi:hypothetical protein
MGAVCIFFLDNEVKGHLVILAAVGVDICSQERDNEPFRPWASTNPSGAWLTRRDRMLVVFISFPGKQERREEAERALSPGCPGRAAEMLTFWEHL